MSVVLKGCNFEHTDMSIHFLSFNDECRVRLTSRVTT